MMKERPRLLHEQRELQAEVILKLENGRARGSVRWRRKSTRGGRREERRCRPISSSTTLAKGMYEPQLVDPLGPWWRMRWKAAVGAAAAAAAAAPATPSQALAAARGPLRVSRR